MIRISNTGYKVSFTVSIDTTAVWTSEITARQKVAEVFNFELDTSAF